MTISLTSAKKNLRATMAHTLENMAVSEAVDAELQTSHDMMMPSAWTNYTDRVRATHWFERFPGGDGRRLLTWKGRFANVTNIVNFYSTQEEVVCNGDGRPKDIGREYSWYNQEYCKGSWTWMVHPNEGGWAFNSYYDASLFSHMVPSDAAELTDAQLQQTPFFLDFSNPEMHTSSNGAVVATNYLYRAEMLAYAIPSESYAVGANPLPRLNAYTNLVTNESVSSRNFNMASFTEGQEDLPANGGEADEKYRDWQHSTYVQRSYKRTRHLFREIVKTIKGENE